MNNFFIDMMCVNTYCLKSTFFKDIRGELDQMHKKRRNVSHVTFLLTCVSANSLLNVYSAIHTSLKIFKQDLHLQTLRAILEHDLMGISPGNQLYVVVVDFKISTDKTIAWHNNHIRTIFWICFQPDHPKGVHVSFTQVFMSPNM